MKDTKISWAHGTVNFWTGCNHVSAECEGCYADTLLERMGRDFTTLSLTQTWPDAHAIDRHGARTGGTAIIFTCSLSDFFHQQADQWRNDAWRVIRDCRHVRWLILTKRPERIKDHLPADWGEGWNHVWLGVTVGQRSSYHRLDELRKIPCALRFISAEPLLESIADVNLDGIGWVAAGGMSGSLHKKRRMDLKWALELYQRCQVAEIPFLFKQTSDIHTERGIDGLSRYICDLEGREHSGPYPLIREYPVTDPPLLPFAERGRRYTDAQWAKLLKQATQPNESSEGGGDLIPVSSITYLAAPV
jgi:protein gp37